MEKLPEFDMYEFIDDGVNKSFYTILGEYIPEVNKNFSTANLINSIPNLRVHSGNARAYKERYKSDVLDLIKVLNSKAESAELFENSTNQRLSEEETATILEELNEAARMATQDGEKHQVFETIPEALEFATKTIDDSNMKPLRDAIVINAIQYDEPEHSYVSRLTLLKTIFIPQAIAKFNSIPHEDKKNGKVEDWDKIGYIRRVFSKPDGLREYDEYYRNANARIKVAMENAIKRERTSIICEQKRYAYANAEIAESLPTGIYETSKSVPAATLLFDKLKRNPEKHESSWSFESFQKPEVICDMEANYSEAGIENQRVIAIRYGKFKYQKPKELGVFNIDESYDMPELVGITRLGKDGLKNYFVLMPPLSKLVFRPKDDPTVEADELPYSFKATEKSEIPTRSGKNAVVYQEKPVEIVDKNGVKYNTFLLKGIPDRLKDYYAKVYFSDEYLSQVISNNARYLGNVEETDDGIRIRPSDIGKEDLAAAHYAIKYPGIVDGRKVRSLEQYCNSTELEMKQFTMIQDVEKAAIKKANEAPEIEHE